MPQEPSLQSALLRMSVFMKLLRRLGQFLLGLATQTDNLVGGVQLDAHGQAVRMLMPLLLRRLPSPVHLLSRPGPRQHAPQPVVLVSGP